MTTRRETIQDLVATGQEAPSFTLSSYPAGTVSLADFKGKKTVILAFYPKDDTPGCTKEMCAFSDDLSKFADSETVILGISCDTTESHEKFASKYGLNQVLLADSDGKVGKAYGTVAKGQLMANRVLFIIDKQGIVRHVFEGMPDNAKLLEVVSSLK